jgi:3,4-dihydroxyphthalate decarboxylase
VSADRVTTGELAKSDTSTNDLRSKVAIACRALALRGVATGILGHVSARTSDGNVLIRCRGPQEHGVRSTTADAVRLIDLEGRFVEDSSGWELPKELPIHLTLYRTRPEIGSVVHAHPRSALICGLAEFSPRPVFGAYNIPAMNIANQGVPVYPRSVLITRSELAQDMVNAMGGASVCILKGHGIVTVGPMVEAATVAAINLDELLSITISLAQLGVSPPIVTDEDIAELPDLGSQFNDLLTWRALVAETCATETGGDSS